MSTRATRSSARKAVNGKSTSNVESTTKLVVVSSEQGQRRRQRKKVDDLQSNGNGGNPSDDSDDGEVHVTPPKQRKPCEKANALSPSTLLHRLSIGEQNESQSTNGNAEKPKRKESKIDNARKVLNAAETEELYGREKEIDELNDFLTSNSAKKTSASIYISGQPGNGNGIYTST